MVKLKKTSD